MAKLSQLTVLLVLILTQWSELKDNPLCVKALQLPLLLYHLGQYCPLYLPPHLLCLARPTPLEPYLLLFASSSCPHPQVDKTEHSPGRRHHPPYDPTLIQKLTLDSSTPCSHVPHSDSPTLSGLLRVFAVPNLHCANFTPRLSCHIVAIIFPLLPLVVLTKVNELALVLL